MTTIPKVYHGDLDITYEAVDANLVGGFLVVPSLTATSDPTLQGIALAGANAINVLGISSEDAVTLANRNAAENGTGLFGVPVMNLGVPDHTVTVYENCVAPANYLAGTAVKYGDGLKAAAGGTVTLWVDGTDSFARKVGWCAQPGGVGTGGGVALARISV